MTPEEEASLHEVLSMLPPAVTAAWYRAQQAQTAFSLEGKQTQSEKEKNKGRDAKARPTATTATTATTAGATTSNAPLLVSWDDFWDFEQGHVWATAHRWSLYWTERAQLFGEDDTRAWGASVVHLPSLSQDELGFIKSGMILPSSVGTANSKHQEQHLSSSVLHVNLSRKPALLGGTHDPNGAEHSQGSVYYEDSLLAKVLFFWMHVILLENDDKSYSPAQDDKSKVNHTATTSTETEVSKKKRKSFSIVMTLKDWESLDTLVIKQLYSIFCRIFPLELQAVHLIMNGDGRKSNQAWQETLPRKLLNCIVGHSNPTELHQYGVPSPVGPNDFAAWLQGRGAILAEGQTRPYITSLLSTSTADVSLAPPKDDQADNSHNKSVSEKRRSVDSSTHSIPGNCSIATNTTPSPAPAPQSAIPESAAATTFGAIGVGRNENNVANHDTDSDIELQQQLDDNISFLETSATCNQGLAQMKEAIDFMPHSEKEAYLRACQVAPHLVEHETPAIWFLRYDRYDGWAAAKRLVYCWKKRWELFGSRAFLPMSQTGYGALSPEDVQTTLRTGYLVILPESSRGHSTLCYDASRLQGDDAQMRQKRLRCFFYMMSILMEEEVHRQQGVEMLGILNTLAVTRSLGLKEPRLLVLAFPINVRWLHGVRSKTKLPLLKAIVPVLTKYLGKSIERTTFHFGNEGEVIESLKVAGLSSSILPAQIGGTWTYDNFTEWCDERCQFELERYPSMSSSPFASTKSSEDEVEMTSTANAATSSTEHAIAQNALEAFMDSQNKEQKANRRRQLRVLYSRQKRKRQKNMLNGLHEQVFDLRNEQVALQSENKRLSQLVTWAKETVEPYERLISPSPTQAQLEQQGRTNLIGNSTT